MSAALSKPKYRSLINTYFNKIAPSNESLTALNTSYAKEGAFVYIPKKTVAEKPIEIIHFSSGDQDSLWLQPRNLIVIDKNSRYKLLSVIKVLKSMPL